jgi:5-methylcytosine-specific restriction endonuclease McrA
MQGDKTFSDASVFAAELRSLRALRRSQVIAGREARGRRVALTRAERSLVLNKAGGRCHICGGGINGNDWEADHVVAHSSGGTHAVANYLPAHSICNSYRWHYDTEEFQWILKLGVWLRTQIERETRVGQVAAKEFCDYERQRAARRKPPK